MKSFAVYLSPDNNLENTKFIQEGFSFKAFVFTIFWALFNRLYLVSFLLFASINVIRFLFNNEYFSYVDMTIINLIGIQLLCGINAMDWMQNSLIRKNFSFAGIIFANNLTDAQMKFFSEYNITENNHLVKTSW